jgi:LacI family transcriptional regulator
MKQQRRPTIKRIAALAEVSRGTVDRALNNRSGVDPAVAERIRRIADELGYAPHKAAKSLRFNHSPKTIGIVLPSVNRAFFDQIVEGVHQAAQELRDMGIGTTVNTVDAADDTLVERAMNDMIEAHVAGLIITGPDTARVRSAVNRAVEVGIPVITINSDIPDSKRLCFVGQDLAKSGRVAGELMAKTVCGSGRVLAITGNLNFQAHNDRIVGFREGLLRWRMIWRLTCARDSTRIRERSMRYEMPSRKRREMGCPSAASIWRRGILTPPWSYYSRRKHSP